MLDDHKVEPSFFRYYSTKIGQQIFIEEDPNHKCSSYKKGSYNVRSKEKSTGKKVFFQDCDNDFIRKALKIFYPDGFNPIWATDDLSEVTTHLMTNNSVFYHKYNEIVIGTEDSGEVLKYIISFIEFTLSFLASRLSPSLH